MCPAKHCLQIEQIPINDIDSILNAMGKHLSSTQGTICIGEFSITKNRLAFGQIECVQLASSSSLIISIESCLQIIHKLSDTRILHSDYLLEMENVNKEEIPATILTTKMIYPRMFNRDVSFWAERNVNEMDIELEFSRLAWSLFGPNLISISLKDRYIKSPTIFSYCFSLKIQSLDRGLNRWKVADMVTRLQEQITEKIPNIKLR